MTTRHGKAVTAAVAALALTAAISGLLLFWLLRPYDSVTFTPFETDRDTYAAGDTVIMRNTFCWDGTPFLAERFLLSRVSQVSLGSVEFPWGYAVPEVAERYANGCSDTTIKVEIPPTTPAGAYRISYEVSYAANPVRVVRVANESSVFHVTPPES